MATIYQKVVETAKSLGKDCQVRQHYDSGVVSALVRTANEGLALVSASPLDRLFVVKHLTARRAKAYGFVL
jgi:hypothetical protein